MSAPIPTLTPDQLEHVQRLVATLDREQTIWMSGYFAGLAATGAGPGLAAVGPAANGDAAANGTGTSNGNGNGHGDGAALAAPAAAGPATRTLTVLFGTDTGNAKELAGELAQAAQAQGV